MISIRIKYRQPAGSDDPGVIYYELVLDRSRRYITTSYKLFPQEWDTHRSIININTSHYHRRGYLQKIEKHITRDILNLQKITCMCGDIGEVTEQYSELAKRSSLFYFTKYIRNELLKELRTKTAQSYKTAVKSFSSFLGGKDITFDEIGPLLIKQYEQYLRNKHVCNNTISFYMRILRAIYNRAVNENLTDQCFPFKGVYVGIDKTVKRAVDINVISLIKTLQLPEYKGLEFARDMFLLSFYCRGMAFIDIANLTKDNIKDGYIIYKRHKTGQELSIKIEPCVKNILERYGNMGSDSKYLLPVLTGESPKYESALRLQNLRLKKISEIMGMTPPLTSYVARHSWATYAKRKGVPIQIISEGMGHNSEKTTLIYLSSLDRVIIDRINAKLLSEI